MRVKHLYRAPKSTLPVFSIWLLQSDNSEQGAVYRFVPDGYIDWVIHLGAPWAYQFTNGEKVTHRSHVIGQFNRHMNLYLPLTGNVTLLGIKFYPWMGRSIWGADMAAFTEQPVALDELSVAGLADLEEEIREAYARAESETVFLARTEKLVRQFLRRSARGGGPSTQPAFMQAGEQKVGKRRLEQLFKQHIGLGRKRYERINRFCQALSLLRLRSPETPLSEVAFKLGYYDQAHFNRDFASFVGMSPAKFLKAISPDGDILNLRIG